MELMIRNIILTFLVFSGILIVYVHTSEAPRCTLELEERKTDCSGRRLASTILLIDSDIRRKISNIDFSNNNIDLLEGLNRFPNLTDLNFSLNLIENISSDAFSALEKLTSIDLSYNNLENINPFVFMNNTKLERLNFQGNLIQLNPSAPFICSTSLKILNLGTCALSTITAANFVCLPSLTELDVSSNAITSLTPSVFFPLSHLKVINLRVNRFYCDCKLPELIKWAKSKKTDLSSSDPIYCVLSQNKGRREYSKIVKDLNCSTDSSSLIESPVKRRTENSSSDFYDYILISYDTNIQPADAHIAVSFMGLISSKLYTIEALLSLVLFLLVLITVMMFCRHYKTVGEVSAILNDYSVQDHYYPDKMSAHLIEKSSKDHTYVQVK
ncbi:hypothetical protein R5R35_013151 [Gryllus longicercus]|uniref:Toll-like receptor n=1 Tax=Gryllus longicercus TaxID=2509291 RepID=A0AAN9V8N3_9ORTH